MLVRCGCWLTAPAWPGLVQLYVMNPDRGIIEVTTPN